MAVEKSNTMVDGVEILKPRTDNREYRKIVLKNSLQVLLISDPDTDKCAASMSVSIGSFSDPQGLEGLAHFLEHMLFYASAKYPEEDSYSKYITEHGGSTNAYTSSEETNYHFDINADCFSEALDRFAQFFIKPLMSAEATMREIKAVDSENQKNLLSDGWRMRQLQKHLSNEDHPFHKFSTGNMDTLHVKPQAKGVDTTSELIKFYEEHYSANIMHLVVYGKESLDKIQDLVEGMFQEVQNTNKTIPRFPGQPCTSDHLQILVKAVPIKQGHKINVSWPVTPSIHRYEEAPCRYLGHLIGHEGEGSLFHALKTLGWATGLSAGEGDWTLDYSFFTVSIELTDAGHEHMQDILGLLFKYIQLLQQTGVCQWIFDELAAICETKFHYQDKTPPMSYIVDIASNLQIFPTRDWLVGLSLPSKFNPATIQKVVDELSPSNARIFWEARTNHVTWLLAQIIRVELVMTALNSDPRKAETTRKILSFHREDRADPNNPQSVLLDFVSSCQNLRIWSLSATTRAYLNNEQLLKGKQIDEWWRSKGERMMDYMNLDDRSIGMFWVVSYTMAQPACETVINWLSSAGVAELLPGVPPNERTMMMQEVSPLPMSLLSGFSMNLCLKLALQMEEALFVNQLVVPSIAMVETYTRLLLISPHSMFRSHFTRNASLLSKPPVTLLVLEILNYRLLPLYRYQGKTKSLMYDVTKILSALKVKRSDHRVFRLAENLCMNLILSLRDFFSVKRDQKGPTDFTETLSRITIMTLAITIKTRGIADADHLVYLQTMLEQVLATSQHTWSEKTLRHFPSLLRDALIGRVDKRGLSIQAWQQAETTVLNQCTQLLSPAAEPSYVMTYLSHSFPQHRQYLCAGACLLMQGNPDKINSANLARVLREVTPDEVTANIYTFVDVLLHNVHVDLQRGHGLEEILNKNDANLAFFFWTHEMLPLDIFLLALIDRDDDPHALIIAKRILERPELLQRINVFCVNRGNPEHWLCTQVFKRNELQKALGNHLSWKDNWYPTFFDDIAARLLPVIPLVVYRLIENNAMDTADKILTAYSNFLAYHPFRFTFVRDILAYFYGHLPGQLVVKILRVLGLSKIPFSESFPQYITHTGPATCPPLDYFANLLLNLVNYVIPPLSSSSSHCSSRSGSMADILNTSSRPPHGKTPGASQPGPANASEGQKAFYQIQDPGTYTQLVLETAVIEILSLPVSPAQIISSLVQIIVNIQSTLIHSGNGFHGAANGVGQGSSVLPTSPSGGSTDSMSASRSSCMNTASFVSRSGYTCQQLSCLLIQACGLLLAQLPPEFHTQLYVEASRVTRETWWLSDGKRSQGEVDSAVGYALMDPTWAAQDNTSTAIGNVVALLHAFFSNLPQEWLDGTHLIIKNLRPVTSVAMLRVAFRIMGPLLPRLANTHALFNKTLALLLSTMVDVFGKNSQTPVPVEASQIADLIDFLHHVVHYEGQGGAVQSSSKPRPDTLALIGRAADSLRPDVQHLLSHLRTDPNSSIYAAAHQNTAKTNTS